MLGTTAALAVALPSDVPTLVVALGAGAFGGLLPDIDVGSSKSHKRANLITTASIAIVVAVILLDWIFRIGIYKQIMSNENLAQILVPLAIMIAVCAVGKNTHHRSFMHSISALVVLSACMGVIMPTAMIYFTAGFISHIAADLFNRKGIRLFYPVQKGFCFDVCSSKGKVNTILGIIGSALTLILILFSVWRIMMTGGVFQGNFMTWLFH